MALLVYDPVVVDCSVDANLARSILALVNADIGSRCATVIRLERTLCTLLPLAKKL